MTKDEFVDRYHSFVTSEEADATAEVERVNAEGIEGNNESVAVYFPGQGWAIMLMTAVVALLEMGIAQITEDGKVHAV